MTTNQRRAVIVGTGLIGGSVGLALQEQGWFVSGVDHDPVRVGEAKDRGIINAIGDDPQANLTVIATPVRATAAAAHAALLGPGIVTDVGSVKSPVVTAVQHERFIGGHPMAGSEDIGLSGATPELFNGATWVLTPTDSTSKETHITMVDIVESFGAEVMTIDARLHDQLVAMVSHVPHLTAASLMELAADKAHTHDGLLQLAAGGFRDMTRIAAGDPRMWLDVCVDNQDAILDVLDEFGERLQTLRAMIAARDLRSLEQLLTEAQVARRALPIGAPPADLLSEVWVTIPDVPGELAAVTALATTIDVNVYDVEVAHAAHEPEGRLIMVVETRRADDFAHAITVSGRRCVVHPLR